jgi:cytochrome c oxidase subunit 2
VRRRLIVAAVSALAMLVAPPGAALAHPGEPHGGHDTLNPQSAGAEILGREITFQLVMGGLVYLLVVGLLAAIVVRHRRRPAPDEPLVEHEESSRWIWLGGLALPLVVISAVLAFSASSLTALGQPDRDPRRTIEVIGHRWWWEVRYPDDGIVTANEIVIPVGQPVTIRLRTRDVIHSFWVPELSRKVDMTPGRVGSVGITAERPGLFRGECAEFCGLQHARMTFRVRALAPRRFEAWRAGAAQPAAAPATATARAGLRVFLSSTCAACHTITGTPARGQVGPDLTHLATRLTIAGGTLENNRGNRAGWISDPQAIKRGALMPPAELDGAELQALLDYLETLE